MGQDGTNVVFGAYSNHNLVLRTDNTTRLTIASTGAATFSSSVTASGNIRRRSTDSVFTELQSDGVYATGTDLYLLAPSGRFISMYAGNAEAIRITSGGSVGIGTANPTAKLQVVGEYIRLVNSADSQNILLHADTSRVAVSAPNGNLAFDTANAERMRIFSDGNVSISNSPSNAGYKLDVNGNQRWIFRNSSSEITDLLVSTESANSLSKLSFLWYGNETASLKFHRGGDATGSSMSIWTQVEGGSTTEKVRVTSAGNVGIGTNGPNAQLDAFTSQGGSRIAATHGTDGAYPKVSGISFGATSTSISVSNNGGTTTFIGGAGIYASNSAASNNPTDLVFWTTSGGSTTERMRITSGGNVGIGTDSPAQLLHLYKASGTVVLALQSSNNYGYLFNDGTNIGLASNIGSTGLKLLVNRNAPDNSMSITSGGNVLIGTTSDNGARLQVSGNGHFSQADANVYIQSTSGSGKNWQLQSFSDGNLYINVSGVFSALSLNGSTGAATFSSSVTAASFIPSGSTIPTNGMYLPSANTIAFSTNTTQRISVSSAGEVQLKQSSNSAQNSVIFNTTIQNAMTLNSSGFLILNGTTGSSRITCYGDGYFSGGIQTGNPYGSTSANWLLGRFLTETTSANGSIRVQIGSKYYNIAAEDLGEVPT